MEQINTEKFDELLKGDKPVVCDFFATWCGPCKMLAPVMDKVSGDFADKAVFVMQSLPCATALCPFRLLRFSKTAKKRRITWAIPTQTE